MTDSKAFGKELKDLRLKKEISQERLAKEIGTSKSNIIDWEIGSKTPNRAFTLKLVDVFKLEENQANRFFSLAGHGDEETPAPSNVYFPSGIIIEPKQFKLSDYITDRSTNIRDQELQKLQKQLEDTQQAVDEMSSRLDERPAIQAQEEDEFLNLTKKLINSLDQIKIPPQSLMAPVILPPTKDMEIRLVSSTSLQRLEEYRFEENKWYTVTGILGGAILGIIINVATGGQMTAIAWILVITFAVLCAITGWTAWNYQQRGNDIRKQILTEQPAKKSKGEEIINVDSE